MIVIRKWSPYHTREFFFEKVMDNEQPEFDPENVERQQRGSFEQLALL
jgi:hypothetical protein